jgi:hypothetical protein
MNFMHINSGSNLHSDPDPGSAEIAGESDTKYVIYHTSKQGVLLKLYPKR